MSEENSIWNKESLDIPEKEVEKSLKLLLSKINIFELGEKYRQEKRKIMLIYGISAAFLIPFFCLTSVYFFSTRNVENKYVQDLKFVTPVGELREIFLPDGTLVVLNSGSVLIAPEEFVTDERKVFLLGEAYFKVAKIKDKPFRVKTLLMDIEALGTEFSVIAFPEKRSVKTTLVEGIVKINANQPENQMFDPVVLKPNQQAYYKNHDKEIQVKEVIPTSYISWTDGRMIFEETPFEEVIERVEIQTGTKINYHKRLDKYKITAKFIHKESLDEVLSLISQITYSKYKNIDEDEYYIN